MSVGLLDIDLVRDAHGRTRVAGLVQQFPQRVTVPMYLDPADRGRAHLCVQNPSAGTFPGDRLTTRVTARPGTYLYLTSQSATQVFAPHRDSAAAVATSDVEISVAAGAVVEYFPKTVIPQSGSAYRQTTTLSVDGDGIYLGWESLAAGRIGHGERYGYTGYDAKTTVSCDGRVRARDRLVLRPGEHDVTAAGVLHGRDYVATLLVVAPGRDMATLCEDLRRAVPTDDEVAYGVSVLPAGVGVWARILAHRAPALQRAEQSLRATARTALVEPVAPSKVRM